MVAADQIRWPDTRLPLLLALALLVAGCASTGGSGAAAGVPVSRAKIVKTQSGQTVTLEWPTEPGERYTIVYSPDLEDMTQWKILPGYNGILATGERTRCTFQAPAPGRIHYRTQKTTR